MNYLKLIGLTACLFILSSCSDFLEEYSQDTYYVTSYKDLDELLIGDCYMPVHASAPAPVTSNIGYFLHFMADEMEEQNSAASTGNIAYDIQGKVFGYYTWQQRVGQNETYTGFLKENETWTESYRLINVANNIIASVKEVPQVTTTDRLGAIRVNGEAHFLRAAYYFWLVNLYGKPYVPSTAATDLGVPIKVEEKINDVIYQRNTVQEVYDLIVNDLQVAENELAQTEKVQKTIYRADSTTVHLLMSRVYLYMQNWEMAAKYADKVLKARATLTDMNGTTAASGFLSKESKETIFSMGGNDIPCNMNYFYQGFRVSHDLYDTYEENDLRKSQWWWTWSDFIGYTKIAPGSTYEASAIVPTQDDYYSTGYYYGWERHLCPVSDKFLYRTAEAYLNKAEAEAYAGNESEARKLLNTLRQKRYKAGTAYEVSASGEVLIKEIREERRKELALEGHRWFDLRRYMVCSVYPESKSIVHKYTFYTGRIDSNMTQTYVFELAPNDPAYTLPIPQEVIDFNTGMKNNERPWRTYTVTDPTN